jgi:hypothetical protein
MNNKKTSKKITESALLYDDRISCDLSKPFDIEKEKGTIVHLDGNGILRNRKSQNGNEYTLYTNHGYSPNGGLITIACFGSWATFIHRLFR